MEDKITLQRIETLHPKLREDAKKIYAEICTALNGKAICRFSHTLRSFAEQDALYQQGRQSLEAVNAIRAKAKLGPITEKENKKVTNAKAGTSAHNYAAAIDIVLLVDKDGNGTFESASWETTRDFDADGVADWLEIVLIFKKYGWEWGGDWKGFQDTPHFQNLMGNNISNLLSLYMRKYVDKGGYVLL